MQITKNSLIAVKISRGWKKRPITTAQIERLKSTELCICSFQRIARTYYKTSRVGQMLFISDPVTSKQVQIDFRSDSLGYIKAYVRKPFYFTAEVKTSTNKGLMRKLRALKLI